MIMHATQLIYLRANLKVVHLASWHSSYTWLSCVHFWSNIFVKSNISRQLSCHDRSNTISHTLRSRRRLCFVNEVAKLPVWHLHVQFTGIRYDTPRFAIKFEVSLLSSLQRFEKEIKSNGLFCLNRILQYYEDLLHLQQFTATLINFLYCHVFQRVRHRLADPYSWEILQLYPSEAPLPDNQQSHRKCIIRWPWRELCECRERLCCCQRNETS